MARASSSSSSIPFPSFFVSHLQLLELEHLSALWIGHGAHREACSLSLSLSLENARFKKE